MRPAPNNGYRNGRGTVVAAHALLLNRRHTKSHSTECDFASLWLKRVFEDDSFSARGFVELSQYLELKHSVCILFILKKYMTQYGICCL